jgi:hypothetical protein
MMRELLTRLRCVELLQYKRECLAKAFLKVSEHTMLRARATCISIFEASRPPIAGSADLSDHKVLQHLVSTSRKCMS